MLASTDAAYFQIRSRTVFISKCAEYLFLPAYHPFLLLLASMPWFSSGHLPNPTLGPGDSGRADGIPNFKMVTWPRPGQSVPTMPLATRLIQEWARNPSQSSRTRKDPCVTRIAPVIECQLGPAGVLSVGTAKKTISEGENLKQESIGFVDTPSMGRARRKENKRQKYLQVDEWRCLWKKEVDDF